LPWRRTLAATRWERIEELFEAARPMSASARESLLAVACADDQGLSTEVEAMIAAYTSGRALAIERLAPPSASVDAASDPVVGTRLGPWRVVRILGRGGMGTVYLAERADGQYQQQAALKLVSQGSGGRHLIERFRTERQVLARLAHPNIARLLDGGFASDGRPYLVMELVDGAPITQWCRARNLSVHERLRLFRVVCEAVQHAHGALVVHRDLKPANIFVSSAGEVKLLDFGIAKLLEPASFGIDVPMTRGELLFTPEYAAPEQLLGEAITTASDVYALGVVLYELLTGERPLALEGKTPVELERAIASTRIVPPSERNGLRRGDDLDCIVLTSLRVQPERRYVSAAQLAEEIGRFLDGLPVLAQPDTLGYRARKFIARHRGAVVAAALVGVSIAGFGVLAGWQAHRAALERDVARVERDKAEKVVGLLVDLFESSNPNVRPDGDKMSVREFLSRAERRVLDQLQGEPAVGARLRQVFGSIYAARDQYPEARRALEEALAEQRRLLGPDHPEALESLHDLGVLCHHMGDAGRGRQLLEESLERCGRVFGPDHEKTARALVALGKDLSGTVGHAEEACPLFERALKIRRRTLPPNHPDLAASLSAMASCYLKRRKLNESRELYREALAIFKSPEQRRHPGAIEAMDDLAEVLAGLNENAEAETLQLEALALARSVLGPDSYRVAALINQRGVTLTQQGRHAEAEQAFREAHRRYVALLGEDDWQAVNSGRNVGQILGLQGRYQEGLPWLERAMAVREREGRERDFGLYSYRSQRALMLLRLGRGNEAIAALRAAEAGLLSLGTGSDDGMEYLALARLWLARALSETGQPALAETPARQALAALDRLGPDHPMRAEAACELGRALVETGRQQPGAALLRQCLPIYRAWGRADRYLVKAIERLLAASAPE
jgi:eukaryotic-like serine/threonine-protein kinase